MSGKSPGNHQQKPETDRKKGTRYISETAPRQRDGGQVSSLVQTEREQREGICTRIIVVVRPRAPALNCSTTVRDRPEQEWSQRDQKPA